MPSPLTDEEIVALNRLTLVARLLAGTAHDVNNALMIIGGSAELIAGLQQINDQARRAIDRIQTNASRAADTIQALMQFARDRTETRSRMALRDVVARSLQMRAFAIRRAGLQVSFDAAASPPSFVLANSAQLQQAVLDLIINAEQALQGVEGGVMALEVVHSDNDVVLRISDNGPGIDPELATAAFESFTTTHPVDDATGLGLPAARIIARKHGGEVTLEPRSPGCCAVLRLPAAP